MLETVLHFFTPRFSNNQKARLIHSEIILLIAFVITIFQGLIYFGSHSRVAILGYAANISIQEVVNLTNQKRETTGVSTLTLSDELSAAAHQKGLDMLNKDYWAHVSPDGLEPWYFFEKVGYKYRYAGENLARDFSSASAAVDAWMASPSHKENLLSDKYKEIGIAVVEGDMNGVDTTLIVQLFGTRTSPQLAAIPEAVAIKESPSTEPAVAAETKETNDTSVVEVPIAEAQEIPQKPVAVVAPKVSPFITAQSLSLFVIILLSVVLVIDIIEVERRKISRLGARKFAHLAYLLTIIVILIISKAGEII